MNLLPDAGPDAGYYVVLSYAVAFTALALLWGVSFRRLRWIMRELQKLKEQPFHDA